MKKIVIAGAVRTGARLMTTLIHEMMRRNVRYGLAALCVGGGLGTSVIVEKA